MTEWKPDICIYHDPCDDGFASAWCVWKKWGDAVDFRPSNYGLPVPGEGIDGKRILIVDFSFKPDVIEAMAERADSIVILDHHKTAQADLDVLMNKIVGASFENVMRTFNRLSGSWQSKVLTEFDMERSGARMTWQFCFPGTKTPYPIAMIEDRDLWRFKFEDTKAISLLLRSVDRDFREWDKLFAYFEESEDAALSEARAIKQYYDRQIAEIVPTASLKKIGNFDGVPVASAPYAFVSDVGHALLEAHPDAPFAAITVDAHGGRTYSLRSDDAREDVSAVAKSFGGGGHRNAAGFRVPA